MDNGNTKRKFFSGLVVNLHAKTVMVTVKLVMAVIIMTVKAVTQEDISMIADVKHLVLMENGKTLQPMYVLTVTMPVTNVLEDLTLNVTVAKNHTTYGNKHVQQNVQVEPMLHLS